MIRQFICFSGVGVLGTIAHYAILVVFVELFALNPLIGSIAGFLTGAFVNYIFNYKFTFKSTLSHHVAMTKFLLIASIGFCLNIIVMFICVSILELYYILSQMIATVLVLFWNFGGSRFWIFNKKASGDYA